MLAELLEVLPNDRLIYIHVDGAKVGDEFKVEITKNIAQDFARRHEGRVFLHCQDKNLGNRGSFDFALDWIYEFEERVILLEEDIRFNETFFSFMDWALARFESDSKIFAVNGFSSLGTLPGPNRVFYSYTLRPWGFGTWKSRWEIYKKIEMPSVLSPELFTLPIFDGVTVTEHFKTRWLCRFERSMNQTDTYDYPWIYAAWTYGSFHLAPYKTFTTNIGYDNDSLHTFTKPFFVRSLSSLKSYSIEGLKHKRLIKHLGFYDVTSDLFETKSLGLVSGRSQFLIAKIYSLILRVRQSFSAQKSTPKALNRLG